MSGRSPREYSVLFSLLELKLESSAVEPLSRHERVITGCQDSSATSLPRSPPCVLSLPLFPVTILAMFILSLIIERCGSCMEPQGRARERKRRALKSLACRNISRRERGREREQASLERRVTNEYYWVFARDSGLW